MTERRLTAEDVGALNRALIASSKPAPDPRDTEIVRLRTALQNCRMFFDANNRPNHVAMIDEAIGDQKVGDK